MGKSKIQGYKSLKKDSFSRLFDSWCEESNAADIAEATADKEEEETPAHLRINELRLARVEATLDLHGCTADEAEFKTKAFLKEKRALGLKKVEVITGKGIHSKDGRPVVRDSALMAFRSVDFVREYYNPAERFGGSGTFHVIFKL